MTGKNPFDDLKPGCPAIYFKTSGQSSNIIDNNYYSLHVSSIDIHIECYIETSLVTMKGVWLHNQSKSIDCVFMIPMRGEIMDCTIEIDKPSKDKIIRTTAIVPFNEHELNEDNEISEFKNDDDNNIINDFDMDDDWNDEQKDTFHRQISGYYRIPFNNVEANSKIIVSIQYNEPLRVKKHHYYISLPLKFDKTTMNTSKNINDIITITANIRHPLNANLKITSNSHYLEIVKLKTGQSVIVGQMKSIEQTIGSSSNNSIKSNQISTINSLENDEYYDNNIIGRNFELNMQIVADLIQAYRITQIYDEIEQKEIENNLNYKIPTTILISPQKKMAAFARNVIYLIDRAKSMKEVWGDITKTMKYALEKLHPKDNFNIILYDHRRVYFETGQSLAIASETNKETALEWLESYSPADGTANMIVGLEDAFDLLKQTPDTSFNTLIFITHTTDDKEQQFAEKLTKSYKNDIKFRNTRIWCIGIGPWVNYYFLEYISRLSRGKAVQLLNQNTICEEMIDYLNEFRVPVMREISVIINYYDLPKEKYLNEICFPYPIPDLYHNHPLLIKIDLEYKKYINLKSIEINGIMATGNGNEKVTLPTLSNGNDFLPSKFPMNLIFAKQQIDYFSSMAWYNQKSINTQYDDENEINITMNNNNNNYNEQEIKENELKRYKTEANILSENYSIKNPWRAQMAYKVKDKNELKQLTESLLTDVDNKKYMDGKISKTEYVDRRTGMGGRRRRQNRAKNKKAAAAAVALIGVAAFATILNPFGDSNGADNPIFDFAGDDVGGADDCCDCGDCDLGNNDDSCCVIM